MATFYYNSGLETGIVTQWVEHLQHEAYVKDVSQIISKNSNDIREAINKGNNVQVEAINNVCGQLEDVNFHLQSIDSNITELRGEINSMASMIDWKMSRMIEEQKITNQLLGFIAQLLRIPDSQKQRVYHIEQGLKYLKNAYMENDVSSLFFNDAFEELKKAENIERKDFITLNKIGQIHLYSKNHLDFSKAEDYFLKSARESFAEYNANGTTTSNNLNPSGLNYSDMEIIKLAESSKLAAMKLCASQKNWSFEKSKKYVESLIEEDKSDSLPINNFLISTVESYLLAARCSYLQRKLDKAIEYSEKAYKLIPKFLSAKFDNAKYLASNNQSNKAVSILENIISIDRYFSIKTVSDQDLNNKKETSELVKKLKISTSEEAKNKLNKLTSIIEKNSRASDIINKIKNHLSKDNYLSNMEALDMLDEVYNLKYIDYDVYNYRITKKYVNPQLTLNEFIIKENKSKSEFHRIKKSLENKKSQVINEDLKGNVIAGALLLGSIIGVLMLFAMIGGMPFYGVLIYAVSAAIIGAILGGIYGLFKRPNIKIEIIDNTK